MKIRIQARTEEGNKLLQKLDGKVDGESQIVLVANDPVILEVKSPELSKQPLPGMIKRQNIRWGIKAIMEQQEGIEQKHYKIGFIK